jgi:hypothetical protein
MLDKSMMRKKAMDSLMKEGPSIMVSIKKKNPMMQDKQDDGADQEGMVSMLVTEEEKAMIEDMRKKGGQDDQNGEQDSEPDMCDMMEMGAHQKAKSGY